MKAQRVSKHSTTQPRLVTACRDAIFVWDVETGSLEREILAPWEVSPLLLVGVGGGVVVSKHADGVSIWDGHAGDLSLFLATTDRINAFAMAGDRLLTFTSSEAVVWNMSSGERLRRLEGSGARSVAQSVAVSVGGEVVIACLASLSWAGLVSTWTESWDVNTGRRLHTESLPLVNDLGVPTPRCRVSAGSLRASVSG